MKVILKDYVKGFGEKNDIVEVKNGYGRNYLIPQGLATIATPSAIKMAEENTEENEPDERRGVQLHRRRRGRLLVRRRDGARAGEGECQGHASGWDAHQHVRGPRRQPRRLHHVWRVLARMPPLLQDQPLLRQLRGDTRLRCGCSGVPEVAGEMEMEDKHLHLVHQ